jgi:hypothetical protein
MSGTLELLQKCFPMHVYYALGEPATRLIIDTDFID